MSKVLLLYNIVVFFFQNVVTVGWDSSISKRVETSASDASSTNVMIREKSLDVLTNTNVSILDDILGNKYYDWLERSQITGCRNCTSASIPTMCFLDDYKPKQLINNSHFSDTMWYLSKTYSCLSKPKKVLPLQEVDYPVAIFTDQHWSSGFKVVSVFLQWNLR